MKIYKCDRCGNFINEDDIYKISEFGKPIYGADGKKLITEFDFCEKCANEWDTTMITIKEAFLRKQTIAVIMDNDLESFHFWLNNKGNTKTYADNCDMNLFDPEKENKND